MKVGKQMQKDKQMMRGICIVVAAGILLMPQSTFSIQHSEQPMQYAQQKEEVKDLGQYYPSDWAVEEIEKAIGYDLVNLQLLSYLQQPITREEFSVLAVNLYRVMSERREIEIHEEPFVDTDIQAILEAYKLGIVRGKAPGKFFPNDFLTREEAGVMFLRILQIAKQGLDTSASYAAKFGDHQHISSWAKEAAYYLYEEEIFQGIGNGLFNPQGNLTKEQAIVLVKRMYQQFSLEYQEKIRQLKIILDQQMGKHYQFGAAGPNTFDCSGLVHYVYGKLGFAMPRVAAAQTSVGRYIPKSELQYGDLVFFARDGQNIHHVGIYVGSGYFVHAPQTGDVVRPTTLESGYYYRTYKTARRLID